MASAAAAAVVLAACGAGGLEHNPKDAGGSKALTLSVNSGFATQVPYNAPVLVAQKEGFFAKRGVKVDFHTGTNSSDAMQLVAGNKDTLAWVDQTQAAKAISSGNPIISVADIQAKGELGLISLASANIRTPADIKGKRIGSAAGGSDSVMLPLFLKANGLTKDDVDIKEMPGNARLPAMLAGKIDLVSGQGFHYAALLEAKGKKASQMLYADHGAAVIGHGFVANRKMLPKNGEAIRRFLKAYDEGLNYTRDHMDEACQTFLETKVIGFTVDMCKQELTDWMKLLTAPQTEGKPVGWNSEVLWKQSADALEQFGGIKAKPVSEYFTNAYLPK